MKAYQKPFVEVTVFDDEVEMLATSVETDEFDFNDSWLNGGGTVQ